MKTAEDFLREGTSTYDLDVIVYNLTSDQIIESMINFAKYHVQESLKEASKKSKVSLFVRPMVKKSKYKKVEDGEEYDIFGTYQMWKTDKESILNAYQLENIK